MEFPILDNVQTTLQDIQRYIEQHILRLPTRRAMRLLIIISAYYLLRPWLLKLAGLNAGIESTKTRPEDSPAATEALTTSKVATLVSEGIESEDEEDGEQVARRRQRPLQEILEGKNRPRAETEAESDKEIEEFLRRVVK